MIGVVLKSHFASAAGVGVGVGVYALLAKVPLPHTRNSGNHLVRELPAAGAHC